MLRRFVAVCAMTVLLSTGLQSSFASSPQVNAEATPSVGAASGVSIASGPDAGDVWCYVYSTALGLYWAPAGVASGAACLFSGKSKSTQYDCYKSKPVNLGYGLVAKPGAKSTLRNGKCKKGEWGYNAKKHSWSKFTK